MLLPVVVNASLEAISTSRQFKPPSPALRGLPQLPPQSTNNANAFFLNFAPTHAAETINIITFEMTVELHGSLDRVRQKFIYVYATRPLRSQWAAKSGPGRR